MKSIKNKYNYYFTNKAFVFSVIVGILFVIFSLVINFYAGTYATKSISDPVNDIILSNFPAYNVEDIFIYGPLFLWGFAIIITAADPKKFPFLLKSIALFIVVRSVFITLTHIGPFPDRVALDISPAGWLNRFTFGGDLFFSAHTGLPFLLGLAYWDHKLLRTIFIIASVFFGIIVLLGHLHYSIDVLSAFFITYTIYHISEILFKKDKEYFDEVGVL